MKIAAFRLDHFIEHDLPDGMFRRAFVRSILAPKIHAIHRAVRKPHRAVMRMIVILVRRLLHRPRARHLHTARPDQRIVENVRRIAVTQLREKLPADFEADAIRQFLHLHRRPGDWGERSECGERHESERAREGEHARTVRERSLPVQADKHDLSLPSPLRACIPADPKKTE